MADSKLICELLATYPVLDQFGFASFATEAAEASRLEALTRQIIWKEAPKDVNCGGVSILLRPKHYGNLLQSVGGSADGQLAALAGGYLYGPMQGGGGECIFKRTEGSWKLEGCLGTWDV